MKRKKSNMEIATIKELRERTGAGVLDCKRVLEESQGDMEMAERLLKERGLAAAAKKKEREARQGVVEAYIHAGGRVGAIIELNCETDFVARTPEFKTLAHDLAMQVAAMNPGYLSPEDIPPEVVKEQEKGFLLDLGDKPEQVGEKVIARRLEEFRRQVCLLNQSFIKSEEVRIKDLIDEHIARFGENIVLRRFARFELSEG